MKITPLLMLFTLHSFNFFVPGGTKVISRIPQGMLRSQDQYFDASPSNLNENKEVQKRCVCSNQNQNIQFQPENQYQQPIQNYRSHSIQMDEFNNDFYQQEFHSPVPNSFQSQLQNMYRNNYLNYQEQNYVQEEEKMKENDSDNFREDPISTKEDPNVIKQIILIEAPEYIYKHEFNIQQPVMKPPRIYIFPSIVKHEYNITDQRVLMMGSDSGPIVYYLNMNELPEEILDAEKKVEEMRDSLESKDIIKQNKNGGLNKEKKDRENNLSYLPIQSVQSQETIGIHKRKIKREEENQFVTKSKNLLQQNKIAQPDWPDRDILKVSHQEIAESKAENNHWHSSPIIPMDVIGESSKNLDIVNHFPEPNNYYENNLKPEFEIIPAILQNYFYIGPET